MLSGLNLRDPVLINTIGHTAGLLLFGAIIGLLVRDRRTHGVRQMKLSIAAAALALAWNVGSLVALGYSNPASAFIGIVMAASFSVLSLLPAILLHLALKGQQRTIRQIGYAVSIAAVFLHLSELLTPSQIPHQLALLLVAVGFGVLTFAAYIERWSRSKRDARQSTEWFPLACLLLFTSSFPHFGYQHIGSPWAAEIAWHHIGIPVALVVLLRDYRFLLLDTYIRFLMNAALACGYLAGILFLNQRLQIENYAKSSRFVTGLALVAFCLSLVLFAHIRNALQLWIGRVIFRRQNVEDRVRGIALVSAKARTEDELLAQAAKQVAAHLRTDQFTVVAGGTEICRSDYPAVLFGSGVRGQIPWAEARIPLCFSSGETRLLLTGARAGRQRYLSEDLEDMRRLGSAIVEQVERFRAEELKQLATKAELRALQAQINPHFLFNALNTLYGSIDKNSFEARRMVLNLADIFRYFLQGDRSLIPLSEEVRIVQAYLEIESLRLGDRLETQLFIAEPARSAMIPILSIQPIVENAVKHGIAAQPGPGRVTVRAENNAGKLRVSVEDTGRGFDEAKTHPAAAGSGTGLENVRRRLHLSYGPETTLDIRSSAEGSTVTFQIPATLEEGS